MRLLTPWTFVPVAAVAAVLLSGGCIGSSTNTDSSRSSAEFRQFPLDEMDTATVEINGHTLRVWLATTNDERSEGLMHVRDSEMAADQGMLFVFPDERLLSFWMKDTIIPLDIAFARMSGTIVKTHTMPPLTLSGFPSIEPAMFALEVKAGTFERLGIAAGDVISIPQDVFKNTP